MVLFFCVSSVLSSSPYPSSLVQMPDPTGGFFLLNGFSFPLSPRAYSQGAVWLLSFSLYYCRVNQKRPKVTVVVILRHILTVTAVINNLLQSIVLLFWKFNHSTFCILFLYWEAHQATIVRLILQSDKLHDPFQTAGDGTLWFALFSGSWRVTPTRTCSWLRTGSCAATVLSYWCCRAAEGVPSQTSF